MTIAVTRMGALFHYAIPRAIHRAGLLERFYTDLWAGAGWLRLVRAVRPEFLPGPLRKLAGRYAPDLPAERVTAFTALGLQYRWRVERARGNEAALRAHIEAGQRFCAKIIRHGLGGARAVYVTNTQGLELLGAARARGLRTFMEQTIAPYTVEQRLLSEEEARHPGWEEPREAAGGAARAYADREREEWQQSDLILCGSDFVRDALREAGAPSERCAVVPYGYEPDAPATSAAARGDRGARLHVLFVGTLCLRKGLPYFAEAARRLRGLAEFRAVGPQRLLRAGLEKLNEVELLGAVPRSEVYRHYAWADVFVLPSLCEGSATVCYEALAQGLPVVCTPSTGSVVRDGQEGFIIPPADREALVDRLERLARDRDLLAHMSAQARARAGFFTLETYTQRLAPVLRRALGEATG